MEVVYNPFRTGFFVHQVGDWEVHTPNCSSFSLILILSLTISFQGDYMYKRFASYVLFLSFFLLSGLQIANADATFSSSQLTCSSFSATGTTTASYVGVRIWNLTDGQFEGGPALIDSYYNVGAPTAYFAAPGGAFSFTVSFPVQNTGDVIVARVYGTNSPVFGGWDGGTFPQIQVSCVSSFAGPGFNPNDGRINRDPWESFAIYCEDYGIDVYAINDSAVGSLAFSATTDEINAVGTSPSANAVIDSGPGTGGTITLFRRPDGNLEVDGPGIGPDYGKGYVVVFNGCPATSVQTYHG
jgi:hypothetical protein